jgi:hypothetical protein
MKEVKMSSPTSNQSTEYTAVLQYANYYVAMHFKAPQNRIISTQPTKDIQVAKITAQFFAELNKIPYRSETHYLSQSVMTIHCVNEKWYPVFVDAHQIVMPNLSGNHDYSIELATLAGVNIAKINNMVFAPELGLILNNLNSKS